MLKFEHNDKQFFVRFKHSEYGVDFLKKIKRLPENFRHNKELAALKCTEAQVFDEENRMIGSGMAVCSPTDNFSYQVGRRRALKDAVLRSRSLEMYNQHPERAGEITRDFSRRMWQSYFEKHSDGRKIGWKKVAK